MRSDAALQRTGRAKDRTPIAAASGRRQSVNAISAVQARRAFRCKRCTRRRNAAQFTGFLKNPMKPHRRPVFPVADGRPAHIAGVAAAPVQKLKGKQELHFFPDRAPDLNPEEFAGYHHVQSARQSPSRSCFSLPASPDPSRSGTEGVAKLCSLFLAGAPPGELTIKRTGRFRR
ncbi:MAG: transposase [Phycisphaerae bacterium]|nr:MAG: hypothetical protein EDS66_16570 [Planctomycetota bacterium]MBE7457484.1 transposase [Planctomycetia bacterium]MCL4718860.1 transposase [Phycisphaerae bacterium]MCQ3921706.1 hypothetical protein [Planctomycetota bacterium]NUQ09900.1 transposase [Phycisphaerae bacterium]